LLNLQICRKFFCSISQLKEDCDHSHSPHSEDCDHDCEVMKVMKYLILSCGWDSDSIWEYLVCNNINCWIYTLVVNFFVQFLS